MYFLSALFEEGDDAVLNLVFDVVVVVYLVPVAIVNLCSNLVTCLLQPSGHLFQPLAKLAHGVLAAANVVK